MGGGKSSNCKAEETKLSDRIVPAIEADGAGVFPSEPGNRSATNADVIGV